MWTWGLKPNSSAFKSLNAERWRWSRSSAEAPQLLRCGFKLVGVLSPVNQPHRISRLKANSFSQFFCAQAIKPHPNKQTNKQKRDKYSLFFFFFFNFWVDYHKVYRPIPSRTNKHAEHREVTDLSVFTTVQVWLPRPVFLSLRAKRFLLGANDLPKAAERRAQFPVRENFFFFA